MNLTEHIEQKRQQAESICQRLTGEIHELGFTAADIQHFPRYDEADFVLIKDPFSGEHNLSCYWYDKARKHRIGRLQFNSDGTFYAEYDVVKPHPIKSRRFVESVTAWGKAEQIKSEAKLLPMPE